MVTPNFAEFAALGGSPGSFSSSGSILLPLIWRIRWANLNLYFSSLKYACPLASHKRKAFFTTGCEYRSCVLRASWKVRGEETGSSSIVNPCGSRMQPKRVVSSNESNSVKSPENDVNRGRFLPLMNLTTIGNFCEAIKLSALTDIRPLPTGLGRASMNSPGWDIGIRTSTSFSSLHFKYFICWICVDLRDRMDSDLTRAVPMNTLSTRKTFPDVYVICW